MEEFVFHKFGEQFNQIVGPGTYRNKASDLVQWAAEQGQLSDLIERAHEANSGNPRLAEFYDRVAPRLKNASRVSPLASPLTDENIQPPLTNVTKADVEALIFGRQGDTRLPISFLKQALSTGRSVAWLQVPRILNGQDSGAWALGTGWLIGQGLVITNHHVIDARDYHHEEPASPEDFEEQARNVTFRFDYQSNEGASYLECTNATLLASDKELDYAILELTEAYKVVDRTPLRIAGTGTQLRRGTRLNVVQHPAGGPLRYAIRNNFYVKDGSTPHIILYQTDTEAGASGSPVCTDTWEVVALHRASSQVSAIQPPQEIIAGDPITVTVLNEAVRIHTILESLPPTVKESIQLAQSN